MKTLGILGGIGPEASSYFYAEVIRRLRESGAIRRNTDYPQIFINSINAPELVSLEVTDELLEPYARGIIELASLKPDYIVMVCNTIHLFRERLIRASDYEKISDLSQIVGAALAHMPGTTCVVGTAATVTSGLYHVPGRIYTNPDDTQLAEIGNIVISYNASGEVENNRAALQRIIQERHIAGADIFIAGCTEISELLRGVKGFTILDTLELIIQDTVQRIQTI